MFVVFRSGVSVTCVCCVQERSQLREMCSGAESAAGDGGASDA